MIKKRFYYLLKMTTKVQRKKKDLFLVRMGFIKINKLRFKFNYIST